MTSPLYICCFDHVYADEIYIEAGSVLLNFDPFLFSNTSTAGKEESTLRPERVWLPLARAQHRDRLRATFVLGSTRSFPQMKLGNACSSASCHRVIWFIRHARVHHAALLPKRATTCSCPSEENHLPAANAKKKRPSQPASGPAWTRSAMSTCRPNLALLPSHCDLGFPSPGGRGAACCVCVYEMETSNGRKWEKKPHHNPRQATQKHTSLA